MSLVRVVFTKFCSPIGSTLHRLSSPKQKPVKQTQVTRAHQAKKTLCGQTDFSMVSLRKSVAIRFLYQTGASRTQLEHSFAAVSFPPSTVMYSEEGERKNLLTAFEKQKVYSRTELLLIPISLHIFQILGRPYQRWKFPPNNYGKAMRIRVSQHLLNRASLTSSEGRGSRRGSKASSQMGKTPQRSEFPEAKNHPSMHGISYLPIYTYRFGWFLC